LGASPGKAPGQAGAGRSAAHDGGAACDPIEIYRGVMGLAMDPARRAEVRAAVGDAGLWTAVLEHWQAHRWNPRNLAGLLDLYRRGGPPACYTCGPQERRAIDVLIEEYSKSLLMVGGSLLVDEPRHGD
jgi:hypothetical protein